MSIARTLSLLVLLAGCTKPLTGLRNEPGGNPIVPETALLPYPSDLYLEDDASLPSGKRLVFPAEALLEGVGPELFSEDDGFSRVSPILTWFPDGVDGDTLPAIGESIEDDSPVWLIDLDRNERVPAIVELDLLADNIREQVLIIRPARTLHGSTQHAVVIRDGVRLIDGSTPRVTEAFRALRDDIRTDSGEVEALREDFEPVRTLIEEEGIDPETVIQAWTFTTRSAEQVWQAPLAMHDTMWTTTLEAPTIDENFEDVNKQLRIIRGTFVVPSFLNDELRLVRDEDGTPIVQGEQTVEYQVTIPTTLDGSSKVPVVCYGHGFFSNKEEANRSLVESLHHWGMIAVSIDFDGFNSHEEADGLRRLSSGLDELDIIVAQQLQAQSKFTALNRLVTEHLGDLIEIDLGSGTYKPMDTDNVVYAGISNGGTQGLSIMAASPAYDRGALVVPGGGWSHMMQRAVQWQTMGLLWSNLFDDPDILQISLALAQNRFDSADSLNFVGAFGDNRPEGRGPVQISMHEAVHDSQVTNMVTHMVARTAGASLVTPSAIEVWGLDEVTAEGPDGADADTVLFTYLEDVEPSPEGNVPPLTDNDTHGNVRELPAYLDQMGLFLADGSVIQVCDGACDPD